MFNYPRYPKFRQESLSSHTHDSIGSIFTVNGIGFKLVNKQKNITTFKNLRAGATQTIGLN